MEKGSSSTTSSATMKHLRKLFVDKYLESTLKHLTSKDVPVSM